MRSQSLGRLLKDGHVVIAQAAFVIEEFEAQPGGAKDWRGAFILPAGVLLPSGEYQVVLDDGFSGTIVIDGDMYDASNDTPVRFAGSGKPNRQG